MKYHTISNKQATIAPNTTETEFYTQHRRERDIRTIRREKEIVTNTVLRARDASTAGRYLLHFIKVILLFRVEIFSSLRMSNALCSCSSFCIRAYQYFLVVRLFRLRCFFSSSLWLFLFSRKV